MNQYDRIYTADVTKDRCLRSVKLAAAKFGSRFQLSWRGSYGDDCYYGMSMEDIGNEYARKAVMEITARVASKKLDVKVVRYPATAWDHIKESAVQWLRSHGLHGDAELIVKRWGINYVEVKTEANAYWPSLEIPDHEAFVDIAVNARYRRDGCGKDYQ
jgi:hypothetical protein